MLADNWEEHHFFKACCAKRTTSRDGRQGLIRVPHVSSIVLRRSEKHAALQREAMHSLLHILGGLVIYPMMCHLQSCHRGNHHASPRIRCVVLDANFYSFQLSTLGLTSKVSQSLSRLCLQVARGPVCWGKHYSTMPHLKGPEKPPEGAQAAQKTVLYRGFGMIPFRVLVRLKVFQLMGVASLAIPINTFLVQAGIQYLFCKIAIRAEHCIKSQPDNISC